MDTVGCCDVCRFVIVCVDSGIKSNIWCCVGGCFRICRFKVVWTGVWGVVKVNRTKVDSIIERGWLSWN